MLKISQLIVALILTSIFMAGCGGGEVDTGDKTTNNVPTTATASDSPDSNKKDIFDAVLKDNFSSLKSLVNNGADINTQDKDGDTPLIIASTFGNLTIVKYLLLKGAKVDIKNKDGDTALSMSGFSTNKKNNSEIIHLLVSNGADVNFKDSGGNTVLYTAVLFDKVDLIENFLKNGANLNIKNDDGTSALLEICSLEPKKFKQVVELFTKYGNKKPHTIKSLCTDK